MNAADHYIREARPDDLAEIVEIYNASIPDRCATADTRSLTLEERWPWFMQHDPARRPLWVSQVGTRVAGYLSLRDFYGRPAYHITAEFGLYIHPDFRRHGVGSALLQHALDHAPSLGIENLLAFIFAHNTPSLDLCRRHGFAEWGRLPEVADLDGTRRDLVILGRKVTPRTSDQPASTP